MAPWLGVPSAFSDDPWVLSTHIVWLTTTYDVSSCGYETLFWPPWHTIHVAYIHLP